MGSDKGRKQQETTDRTNVTNAITAATTPSPLQNKQTDYLSKLYDFFTGSSGKPIDIRDTPDGGLGMSFYNAAKSAFDNGRVGKGLSYTDGNAADGYNANFGKQIEEENALDKQINASGQLENYTTDLRNNTMNAVNSDIDRTYGQKRDAVGMHQAMYQTDLSRPKEQPWWQSLLGGVAQVGAGWASNGFKV